MTKTKKNWFKTVKAIFYLHLYFVFFVICFLCKLNMNTRNIYKWLVLLSAVSLASCFWSNRVIEDFINSFSNVAEVFYNYTASPFCDLYFCSTSRTMNVINPMRVMRCKLCCIWLAFV